MPNRVDQPTPRACVDCSTTIMVTPRNRKLRCEECRRKSKSRLEKERKRQSEEAKIFGQKKGIVLLCDHVVYYRITPGPEDLYCRKCCEWRPQMLGFQTDRCRRGHKWTTATAYTSPKGKRRCRICRAMREPKKKRESDATGAEKVV